jgi:DNA-binding transcriptional ArsR family regulator
MVERSPVVDRAFAALADPTRRAILQRLRGGAHTVTALAEPFDMSLAAVSKHLGILEGAGLVRRETSGRERLCHLQTEPLLAVTRWTAQLAFWEERLDALASHVAASPRRGSRR